MRIRAGCIVMLLKSTPDETMIIHKLIAQHLKHRDDAGFYSFQALDAIRWLQRCGVELKRETKALDLGCGHGIFGAELTKLGCQVTFADEEKGVLPHLSQFPFMQINLDRDDLATLGQFDLVICSNVLEHLAKPESFLQSVHKILTPEGKLYLSWTNWLSPWGGHEFSPFHFLGAHRGHLVYDRISKRKRKHTPYVNLFPTYIGRTLKTIRTNPSLRTLRVAPRYYSEFAFLMWLPLIREFLAWNCAMLIVRR